MIAMMRFDGAILLWIQKYLRMEWLNPIMIGITTLGNAGIVWIISAVGLLIPKKTRKIGIMCLCALVISLLINNVLLKNLIVRPRPFSQIENLIPLIALPRDFSFPSGHSAASFACACLMLRKLPKKYGIPAIILAILIAASRLYIGVHYPTDVLAGVLSGIGISYLAELIVDKVLVDKEKKEDSK